MAAGPARQARRAALRPPIEISPEQLDSAYDVAAWFARRTRDGREFDADDLRQSAALGLVQHLALHPDDPMPDHLVRRIAAMACRRVAGRRIKSDACEAAAVLRERERGKRPAVDQDDRLDLAAAMDSIPHRQSTAMRLRYLHGMSDREAAKSIGVSLSVVTKDSRQAKATLRETLGEAYRDAWARAVPLRNPDAWKHHAKKKPQARTYKHGRNRSSNPRRDAIESQIALIGSVDEVRADLQ